MMGLCHARSKFRYTGWFHGWPCLALSPSPENDAETGAWERGQTGTHLLEMRRRVALGQPLGEVDRSEVEWTPVGARLL
jgi:hypothetical protein